MFFTHNPTGLLNIKCPSAQLSMLLLWKMATTWQHFFMPLSFFFYFLCNFILLLCWNRVDFQCCVCIRCSLQSLSHVQLFVVMSSNHLILCCPFSSCPQSLPASGSFPMSQLFASGGQSIGVSASTSFSPMNTQDWSPLGWTGWISLQSKGLSRVFSNTTVQKHQFFSAQPSLGSNSHIHTWPLEKP